MHWSEALFQPKMVAVIGSTSPGKMGHVLITQLLDGGSRTWLPSTPRRRELAASSL